MQINLTTFILEMVNFLVLIWILKRLFFVPVKHVIEERKAAVAKALKDASMLKGEAEQLRAQFEGRLQVWEAEKAKAQTALEKDLSERRAKRWREIEASLESESEKLKAAQEKKAQEAHARLEREAIHHGLAFTSRLLENFACPELQAKLVSLTLDCLRGAGISSDGTGYVKTAYELTEREKKAIRAAIGAAETSDRSVVFSTEPSLIAGIEIRIGSNVIRANLRDELALFSEVASQ